MRATTINRLIQAIAVLTVIYVLVLFGQGRQTTSGVAMPANLSGLQSTADKLVIKVSTNTIALEREGAKWFIGKKAVKPAKSAALLTALENLEFVRVVSSDGGNGSQYGLTEPTHKSVGIYHGKDRLRTIVIGNATGVGQFYAKVSNKTPVYEAEGDLASLLEEPVADWTKTKKKAKKK